MGNVAEIVENCSFWKASAFSGKHLNLYDEIEIL